MDADDTAGRAAWAGINAVGFAIANSASYNLPQPTGELQEQEGVVMAEALRMCRTVGDLEQLIAHRLGKRLGVRTNLFAIDAEGGAVIIEQVFAYPGVGWLALIAISQRDYPVVQGVVLVVATVFALTNLLVDVAYTWLNPRIRYGGDA